MFTAWYYRLWANIASASTFILDKGIDDKFRPEWDKRHGSGPASTLANVDFAGRKRNL